MTPVLAMRGLHLFRFAEGEPRGAIFTCVKDRCIAATI
jgi:hypothetical protein